jgi:hypothetical protein
MGIYSCFQLGDTKQQQRTETAIGTLAKKRLATRDGHELQIPKAS